MDDSVLREHLAKLLRGGDAYVTADKALIDVSAPSRNASTAEGLHSIWEELEHMRITQETLTVHALRKWSRPRVRRLCRLHGVGQTRCGLLPILLLGGRENLLNWLKIRAIELRRRSRRRMATF